MDRASSETALQAANVALTGKRSRAVSGFASIELRDGSDEAARWEMLAGFVVAMAAVVAVVVAWLY